MSNEALLLNETRVGASWVLGVCRGALAACLRASLGRRVWGVWLGQESPFSLTVFSMCMAYSDPRGLGVGGWVGEGTFKYLLVVCVVPLLASSSQAGIHTDHSGESL